MGEPLDHTRRFAPPTLRKDGWQYQRVQPTPSDARRSLLDAPLRRLYAELYCLWLTLVFHDGNHHGRKALTILIVGVWALLEVGAAFGYAHLPEQFYMLRLGVGILVGRMWGIELNNFAGVEFTYNGNRSDDGGEDGSS